MAADAGGLQYCAGENMDTDPFMAIACTDVILCFTGLKKPPQMRRLKTSFWYGLEVIRKCRYWFRQTSTSKATSQ